MTDFSLTSFFITPFSDYAFMRRALAACFILALSGTPLGLFMTLRRMTLVGDAMAHAILPGVALAFVCFGLALIPMTVGGLLAGTLVALCAGFLTRFTQLKEDASFTLITLLSLAVGVVLISTKGSTLDLLHLLFGNILAIDNAALTLVSSVACVTFFLLAVFYRGLVIACFDPDFAQTTPQGRSLASLAFFVLLVLNLIASFQALGTLMALGLMLLPALAARFWTQQLDAMLGVSLGIALLCGPVGLLISYHAGLPAGPSVVLTAGILCLASALLGRYGSVRATLVHRGFSI